jgi:hypothetical protein
MRLTRTLRGDGLLIVGRKEVPVAYAIDIFNEGEHCTSNGWIEGACAPFAKLKTARLRLADGVEVGVNLEVHDADSATVEIADPLELKAV